MPDTFTFEEAQPETFSFAEAGGEKEIPDWMKGGGTPAAMTPPMGAVSLTAPSPRQLVELGKSGAFTQPAFQLPSAEIKPDDSFAGAVGKESYNILKSVPEFFTSPLGATTAMTGGLSRLGQAIIKLGFTADMAKQLGETVLSTYRDWDKMTSAQKGKALVDLAGTGTLGFLLGKSFVKDVPMLGKRGRAIDALAEQMANENISPALPAPTPERRVGIGPVPTTPFEQPGIVELADAALRERQQLVRPAGEQGQPALGALRIAVGGEPRIVTPELPSAPAVRIPGGGEAPYGKVSYMRRMEEPILAKAGEILPAAAAEAEKGVTANAPEKRNVQEGVLGERPGDDAQRPPAETGVGGGVRPTTPVTAEEVPRPESEQGRVLLKPDMESARRVAAMTPDEFRANAQSFNKTNLKLGQHATDAELSELRKIRDEVQAKANDAKAKAQASGADADIQAYSDLGAMAQYFNEAIAEGERVRKTEPPPPGAGAAPQQSAPPVAAPEGEPVAPVSAGAPPGISKPTTPVETAQGPVAKLTFRQFLSAPREGPLLEALRSLPKPEPTADELAKSVRYDRASEALDKAGLSWVYAHERSDAAIRGLSKAKQKLVKEYNDALDAKVSRTPEQREAQQRALYDRAVAAGVIENPQGPTRLEAVNERLAAIAAQLKDINKGFITGKVAEDARAPLKDEQTRLFVEKQLLEKQLPKLATTYDLRFIQQDQASELINLYHLARTGLSGKGKGVPSNYDRMLWATKEFSKAHPEVSPTAAYKDLDSILNKGPIGPVEKAAAQGQTLVAGTALEKWANDQLKGGGTHLGPDVLAAYLVKGVGLMERGVIKFADWAQRMIAEHGQAITPKLRELYAEAKAAFERRAGSPAYQPARDIFERQRATAQPAQPAVATTTTQATTPATPRRAVTSGLDDIYKIFEPEKPQRTPIRRTASNIIEAVRTGFSSKFRPLNKLAEDIAKAYGIAKQNIAGIFEQLKGSRGKGEADVYRFDRAVSDLVGKDTKDFNAYMFLNRSLDRLRADLRDVQAAQVGAPVAKLNRRSVAGYTIPELEAKLATLEAKLGPENLARFREAATRYQAAMDSALRLQVESGRMSQEVYNAIKADNQFYAPFKVMKWLEEGMRPEGSGRKVDTLADYTKAMTGIEDPNFKLGDMLSAARQNLLISRILADKATAMRKVADLATQDTQAQFIKKLGPKEEPRAGWKTVNVFENGKPVKYATNPEVVKAIELFGDRTGGFISGVLQAASIPFKAGATALNIPFQVSNLLADVPRQALVSRYGIRGVSDLIRYPLDLVASLHSSILGDVFGRKNKLFLDFLDSGAAATTVQESLTPEALRFRDPATMSKAKRVALSILYSPAEFAAAIESTSKIMGIKRAMRFEGVTSGADLAKRIPAAVTEIRRFSGSPDFGRQGSWTETARLNLLYMFLNARIQGAIADIGRLAGRDGAKRAAITWMRLGTAIGAPTVMLYALNNSPEHRDDYAKRPVYEKENYWLIPKGSYVTNEQGEKVRDYWRVPKRESSKWIANMVESGLNFAQKRDPQALGQFLVNTLEDISPVNIQGRTAQERIESVGASLNPVIKAPLEVATQRDMFRHRPLIPDTMKKASPELQYTDRTPEAFKVLANKMPDVAPEFLRSPIMLENMTRNLTAGLITQFLPGKPVEGRSRLANIPLLQRFQAIPYTDNAAFTEEMRQMDRESADEYLNRHRKATDMLRDGKDKSLPDILRATKDPKIMQQVVDLWVARKNGVTQQDRQLIGLPPKQRAELLAKRLSKMTPEQKKAAILDWSKKRVLTKSVFVELGEALP